MVLFVAELRKLFALMLKSRRRTINPSPTLLCLRNCSKYDVEMFNQEDVSEFATILVNLLEESFDVISKLQSSTSSSSSSSQVSSQTTTTTTIPVSVQTKVNMIELPIHREDDATTMAATSLTTTNSKDENDDESVLAHLLTEKLNIRKNRKNPIVNLLNGDILITRKTTGNYYYYYNY